MTDDTRSKPHHHFYNEAYQTDNYFKHSERQYRPYVTSLIRAIGLKGGSEVLDAGCGQGFFSNLFASEGMVVYATDLSVVGLQMAKRRYGRAAARFFVSDLYQPPTSHEFDCVFVRSCSLHNTDNVTQCAAITKNLLAMVKPGGVLVLAYNTNLSGESNGWRHHRLEDIMRFLPISSASVRLFFINRVATLLVGQGAFTPFMTRVNRLISEWTKLGGEIVAVVRKREEEPSGSSASRPGNGAL